MVRKSLSGILAAAVLISSITTAFADNTFQNSTALNDVLKNSRVYAEEVSGYDEAQYYSFSTLDYVKTLIQSMSTNNVYRLALEEAYSDSDTVEDVVASSTMIWGTVLASYIKGDTTIKLENGESTATTYAFDSSVKVANVLRQILGASATANISNEMNCDQLWDEICSISEANGCGGAFTWQDSTYGGGDSEISVGDQVYFRMSAHYDGAGAPASYTQSVKTYKNKYAYMGSVEGDKDYAYEGDAQMTFDSEGNASFGLVEGFTQNFVYNGLVLDVGPDGVRAVCGNLDISGLGNIGNASIYDAETGERKGTVTTGKDGKTTFTVDDASAPGWGIDITTVFCHNDIDYDSLVENMYSSYVMPDGSMLGFDINSPDLAKTLGAALGDEAGGQLLAAKMQLLYMKSLNEAKYGLTVAESTAWMEVLIAKCEGDYSAEKVYSLFSDEQKSRYDRWSKENTDGQLNIGSLVGFLNYDVENSAALMSNIRMEALTMTANGNQSIEDMILANVENILTYYFEDTTAQSAAIGITTNTGTTTMEYLLTGFLMNIVKDGEINLSSYVPSEVIFPQYNIGDLPIYTSGSFVTAETFSNPASVIIERIA